MFTAAAEDVPANYVQSIDSVSSCFLFVVAHLPLFKSPTLTFMEDPWMRAKDHMHLRCVSRAFYTVAEHLAGIAVKNRRIEICEMATPSNMRKMLLRSGYDPRTRKFSKFFAMQTKDWKEWQQRQIVRQRWWSVLSRIQISSAIRLNKEWLRFIVILYSCMGCLESC